jgi:hypothetical protein
MNIWKQKESVDVNAREEKNTKTGANESLRKPGRLVSENDGPMLCAKATEIALQLNADNFKASNGWLHQLKQGCNPPQCHRLIF